MLVETLKRHRKTAEDAAAASKRAAAAGRRWHAVSIVVRSTACAAAQVCKGKRFLSAQAPRLPLPGCDAAQCGCKYRHHEDRRDGPRRELETPAERLRSGPNRRSSRGRRATD